MSGLISCRFCSEVMGLYRCVFRGSWAARDSFENVAEKLSDVIEMPCPHADSIRRLWERKCLAPYSGRMVEDLEEGFFRSELWTVRVTLMRHTLLTLEIELDGKYGFETNFGLIFDPNEPEHMGKSRVLSPQWIDTSIPRAWYDRCVEEHGEDCRQPAWMRSRPEPNAMPQWLVDAVDNCVVECNSDTTRYIALSYTWGGVPCLQHTSVTIERLKKKGSLHPDEAPDIPRTVRDAFQVTKLLGERYLWVDSLCIPQGEGTASKGLNSMHHIYANSTICLVALAGTDANHGLRGIPGVSAPRHVEQVICDIADGERLLITDPWQQLRDSKARAAKGSTYNDRGWTCQEYAFAKRRLIFTDGPLRWVCKCGFWGEEAHGNIEVDVDMMFHVPTMYWIMSSRPGPDMGLIESAGDDFNTRYFTFEGDTLKAFLGVQNYLSRNFLGGLNHGHPNIFFDISLLWQVAFGTGVASKRRLGGTTTLDPPSWSWMGWQGNFIFVEDEELLMCEYSGVGFTQSVAKWYTMHHPLAPASDMQPVNCQWPIHRAAVENGSARLPIGWQKVTYNEDSSEHCYRRELTGDEVRPSNPWWPVADFKYPIPFPLNTETATPIEQRPFVFARTTRSFFTAKRLVHSDLKSGYLQSGSHDDRPRYPLGLFCHDGAYAGLLRLHYASDEPCFQVEVVAVVKGWTTIFHGYSMTFQGAREEPISPRRIPIDYDDSHGNSRWKDSCYFVLCVKWENGVAKRQGTGMVEAEIWERAQEPVDLILG